MVIIKLYLLLFKEDFEFNCVIFFFEFTHIYSRLKTLLSVFDATVFIELARVSPAYIPYPLWQSLSSTSSGRNLNFLPMFFFFFSNPVVYSFRSRSRSFKFDELKIRFFYYRSCRRERVVCRRRVNIFRIISKKLSSLCVSCMPSSISKLAQYDRDIRRHLNPDRNRLGHLQDRDRVILGYRLVFKSYK